MTLSRNSSRLVLAGIAVLGALAGPRSSPAQSIRVTEPLFFQTAGEGFFGIEGPLAGKDFRQSIIDESYGGQEGEIYNIDVDVDNATAVAAWETAVSTCDAKEYCKSFPIVGKLCVSPTRSQCIDGATLKVAGYTIASIDGIGPKPSGTIKKNFDVGARLEWNAALNWGVEGAVEVDGGSIDAEVGATATIEADLSGVSAGDVFTLRTSRANVDAFFDTEFPDLNATLGTFIDATALLRAEVAGPDTTDGSQRRFTETILSESTGGEHYEELAGFQVDLGEGALKFRLLGEEVWKDAEPGFEYSAGVPVIESGVGSVELPLMDLGLYLPRLDIPVPADFEGDYTASDYSDLLGEVVRDIGPGNRGGFEFGVVNDGITDLDFGRFDVDVDVLSAMAGWVFGVQASVGEIPQVGSLLEVEGNILDIDSALFFGVQENLSFRPNIAVDLHFSVPVQVETFPGSGEFEEVTVKRVLLGDDLNIVHPGGDLQITPHYTLAENRFINDTDLYLNPAIVGAIFQLRLGGLLYDYGFNGIPENMAAVQLTQNLTPEPVVLKDLNFLNDDDQAEFSLKGFEDVVGSLVSLPAGTSFRRGDSNSDSILDVSDAITTLSVQFLGVGEILCEDAADSNDDGQIDISDPVHTLGALFLGTAEITAPTVCGLDPTDDLLNCAVSNCAPRP